MLEHKKLRGLLTVLGQYPWLRFLVRRSLSWQPLKSEALLLSMAGRVEEHTVEDFSFEIVIISNRKSLARRVQKGVAPYSARIYPGADFPSFSKLVNAAVSSSDCEYVFIVGDKCFPSSDDIRSGLNALKAGFGFVGLYRFGCFAISKEYIQLIGPLDERFLGGGYEDVDYILRMREADLGYVFLEAIPYFPLRSSWESNQARGFFEQKWEAANDQSFIRRLPELHSTLSQRERMRHYLPWERSILSSQSRHAPSDQSSTQK